MTALLEISSMRAWYGDFQALFGIDFKIAEGEVIAVIGANGAGKSTFLKSIVGLNKVEPGMVMYRGASIGGLAPYEIVKKGIALVPEGRRLFPSLTVEENLRMGAVSGRAGFWNLGRIYEIFPILEERSRQPATSLSGGQQQMVAIGRALMSNPALLLCDEISLGLAPLIIRDIYANVPKILAAGTAIVVVEQDIGQAQRISERVYCFQEGRVSLSGRAAELSREQISEAYFGSH